MGYRFKYIVLGAVVYLVVTQAWKIYKNQKSE